MRRQTLGRALSLVVFAFGSLIAQAPAPEAKMLHALGLGENPPSSSEITKRVLSRWGGHHRTKEIAPRQERHPAGTATKVVGLNAESHDWAPPRELVKTDSRAFEKWLDTARPEPLPMEVRARVLRTLPTYGEITRLNHRGQRKLLAVRALLQAMGRAPAYDIKVVDVPVLRVGVYARTVILISGPALSVLGPEELQAVAAHEIGHEYFTADYERAYGLRNTERLKELELMCDAIALVTLERLRINPSRLMSAVAKSASYNRLHFGDAMDESAYPTLSERQVFASEVVAWMLSAR